MSLKNADRTDVEHQRRDQLWAEGAQLACVAGEEHSAWVQMQALFSVEQVEEIVT